MKLFFKMLIGKEPIYKPQVNRPMKWYGDQGAGFFVCEDKLTNSSIVYSFGVGENNSFELEFKKIWTNSIWL